MSDVVARARDEVAEIDAAGIEWMVDGQRYYPEGPDTLAVMNWCQIARQLVSELVAEVEKLRASRSVCQCWVGHGDCGGCSGVVGYGHEPACGWEWNPRCPEHGVLADENRKLRGALETIKGVAERGAVSPRVISTQNRALLDILAVIERAEIRDE